MKKLILSTAVIAALGFSGSVFAGTTANLGLTASVDSHHDVQPRGVVGNEVAFGNVDPASPATLEQTVPLCLYSNSVNTLDIRFSGATGAFQMTNGTDTIPFNVSIQGNGTASFDSVVADADTTVNASSVNNCSGGTEDAMLKLTVPAANFSGVSSGTYNGSLNMTITTV